MPYLTVRGIDVYYEELGSGPHHLLIAHGLFGSVSSSVRWAAEIAVLGMHVVSFDARGHGKSGFTRNASDYYRGALADDMRSLLDALHIEKAHIFGSSMGAGTALMLAAASPDRVANLVLKAPPGLGVDSISAKRTMAKLAFLYRYFGAATTAHIVGLIRGNRAGEMPELLRAQRAAAVVPAIRGLLLEGPPFPLEDLPKIRCPALLLAHDHDKLHPLTSSKLLHDRLPNSELDVAPDGEFWKHHPQQLARRVVDFVMPPGCRSHPHRKASHP